VFQNFHSSADDRKDKNVTRTARLNLPKPAISCPNLPHIPFRKIKPTCHSGTPKPSTHNSIQTFFSAPLLLRSSAFVFSPARQTRAPQRTIPAQQNPTKSHTAQHSTALPSKSNPRATLAHPHPALPAISLPPSNPTFVNFTPTNRLTFRPLRRIITKPSRLRANSTAASDVAPS